METLEHSNSVVGIAGLHTSAQEATPDLQLGEMCRYQARSQEGGIGHTSWKWSTGVWLGWERRAQQFIFYGCTKGGIRYARSILAMPEPQKRDIEVVKGVAATPWSTHEPTVPEVIRLDKAEADLPRQERVAAVRRLHIKQENLDFCGYTQHCPKCQSIIVHGNKAKSTVPHSEQCRARITAGVAKTEEGQQRLQKVTDQSDRFYAEKIRQSETQSGRLQGES